MQSRTREGAGIAGWRLVRIRGREARRPRRHAAYLSCVSRAARRPGGRRTVHRWLCSPLVTAGDAGGLETHHEAGGFAARLSRDARAERLRRASARVEVEDARGHSTPQTGAQIGGWAAKGASSPWRRALRRRDWYSHTTGARDAATQGPSSRTSRPSRAYGWTLLTGWSGSGIWEGVTTEECRRRACTDGGAGSRARRSAPRSAARREGARGRRAVVFINDEARRQSRRAGDAPRGRRLCSPPVTRRSCRAIATCFGTRGGGGREGTLDSTNRGPDWWLGREGRFVAVAKGAASP